MRSTFSPEDVASLAGVSADRLLGLRQLGVFAADPGASEPGPTFSRLEALAAVAVARAMAQFGELPHDANRPPAWVLDEIRAAIYMIPEELVDRDYTVMATSAGVVAVVEGDLLPVSKIDPDTGEILSEPWPIHIRLAAIRTH